MANEFMNNIQINMKTRFKYIGYAQPTTKARNTHLWKAFLILIGILAAFTWLIYTIYQNTNYDH